MANTQAQQTRVLFLDGQTLIFQNESGENAFTDLNNELLQQALQSVGVTNSIDDTGADATDANFVVPTSASTGVAEGLTENLDEGGANNFRLIFQNNEESQGSVRLMADSAEALGLKILVDSEVKQENPLHESPSEQQGCLRINGEEQNHAQHDQQQVVFTTHSSEVEAVGPSYVDSENSHCDGLNENFQSAAEALGALVGATTAGESPDRPVTIIPQLIDGCVSYSVQFADEDNASMDVAVNNTQDTAAIDTSCSFSDSSNFAVSLTAANEMQQEQQQLQQQQQLETSYSTLFSRIREFNSMRTPMKNQITSRPHVPAQKIQSSQSTSASLSNHFKVHLVGGKAVAPPQPEVAALPTSNLARATNFDSGKPLGSSENPIQLVQHGQTFHRDQSARKQQFVCGKETTLLTHPGVQALTQEQLKQIATVLQQQRLYPAPHTKNVVYDAETNTRIIYRVVYPDEFALGVTNTSSVKDNGTRQLPGTSVLRSSQNSLSISRLIEADHLQHLTAARRGRGSGRRGRPPGSNIKRSNTLGALSPEPSDRIIHDEAEEAAKTERKRQLLSRTRSGRLSRPPRHMIKDYKRLHRLDFGDADLDDSDGGYSDYQMSDHENGKEMPHNEMEHSTPPSKEEICSTDPALTTGAPTVAVAKRKISPHFRCPGCQKVYLGHSRMARHLQAFPDHNSKAAMSDNATSSNLSAVDVVPAKDSTGAATAGAVSVPVPKVPNGAVATVVSRVGAPSGPRKKGKRRGPWAYITPEVRSQRRKQKLREVLTTCEPGEVAEVCGRTVCGALSLLELLWLRLETLCANRLLEELAALVGEARTLLGSALMKDDAEDEEASSLDDEHVEVFGDVLCVAMGLECGRYRVDSSKLRPPPLPDEAKVADHSINCSENNVPENLLPLSEGDAVVPEEPELKRAKKDDVKLEASTSPDSGNSSVGMDSSTAGTPADMLALDDVSVDISSSRDLMQCETSELQQCPLEALGLRALPTILQTVKTPESGISNPKEETSPTVLEQPHTPATPHPVPELAVPPAQTELPAETLNSQSPKECHIFNTRPEKPVSHMTAELTICQRSVDLSGPDKPAKIPVPHEPVELPVSHAPVSVPVPHTAVGLTTSHTSIGLSVPHTQTRLALPHQHTELMVPCTPVETSLSHASTKLQVANAPTELSLPASQNELSLPHTSNQLPLSSTSVQLQLHHTPPELSLPQTSAQVHHHTSTEQHSVALESESATGQVVEDLHHSTSHPLDDDLLDGLCCSAEGHPDVSGSEEDPGRQAALQAVDDIVRERLGFVDFLDDIPPPTPSSPSTRVKLPGFASLQIPHRSGGGSVITVPSTPSFMPLPDLSDHIDLDVLGEELVPVPTVTPPGVASSRETVGS